MTLTEKEREKVEKNTGLIHKVIQDKLQPPYQVGMYSYEDLYQIGCIGLCKAASTDKGGTFSTYAYRLIWHQICDAMIYATRRQTKETTCDVTPYIAAEQEATEELSDFRMDINRALEQAKADAPSSTCKGIEAICMMSKGYKPRDWRKNERFTKAGLCLGIQGTEISEEPAGVCTDCSCLSPGMRTGKT